MSGALQTGILCIAPSVNTPGKSDATGAFIPEARAYALHHGYDPTAVVRLFDPRLSLAGRRATVNAHIRALRVPVHTLAFFCHGYRRGLQTGHQLEHVDELASMLRLAAKPDAWVLLYACETGRDSDEDTQDDRLPGPGGDGGFADALRDACGRQGLQISVMGHTTAGHCTQNPNARRFVPGDGGRGGDWYVHQADPRFRAWSRALRDPKATLRYRFATMTPGQLKDELEPPPPAVS